MWCAACESRAGRLGGQYQADCVACCAALIRSARPRRSLQEGHIAWLRRFHGHAWGKVWPAVQALLAADKAQGAPSEVVAASKFERVMQRAIECSEEFAVSRGMFAWPEMSEAGSGATDPASDAQQRMEQNHMENFTRLETRAQAGGAQ